MASMLLFALTLCILAVHALSFRRIPNHYPIRCGPNEIKVPCIDRCQTCEYRYGGCVQPQVCTPGCNCIKGFFRNKQRKCVPQASCDAPATRCQPDEEYRVCSCEKNCCNRDKLEGCGKECLTGCFCRTGLVRGKEGNCIRPENCPSNEPPNTCGVNEERLECGSACPPTCKDRNPEVCTQQCVNGCFCKNGFIRERKGGRCIPESQCPSETCGLNEVYSTCVNICNTCQLKNVTCNFLVCNKGCDCRPGYTRNDQQICIPESLCPSGPNTCGPNSHLSNCASQCPPTCSTPNRICIKSCKVACECDKGFILDDFGNCIPKDQCPNNIVCGPNSKPSDCVSLCEPSCKNRHPEQGYCPQACKKGCACDPGYLKDDNGNCIREFECPVVCGPNSKPDNCISFCEPSCRNPHSNIKQCAAIGCVSGCKCDPGYLKDGKGNCIPEYECPVVCGPNSKPDNCISFCEPSCRNPHSNIKQCAAIGCVSGCKCDPGYLKDDKGNCVPEYECPAICGPNSKPSSCVFCPPTCRNPKPKVCPQSCTKGCVCDPGFLKDDNGNCIPEYECPNTCGFNEERLECGSACPPTCNDRNPEVCTAQCVIGCFCKNGFIRERKGGRCIPETMCPPANCGPNSTPSTCVFCPPTCRNPKPEACAESCGPGCECNPGFLKDDYGNCIPQSECPVTCGPNSTPSDCASNCPRTCNSDREPKMCPAVCIKGCICNSGYIDDGNGNCIPEDECPGNNNVCTKIGEKYKSCGSQCEATCVSIRSRMLIKCPTECKPGCFCKDGLVRDLVTGNCVKANECPNNGFCSKPGEVYKSCGSPCVATCANLRFHILIKCPKPCKPGCFCRDGLVRDSNNNCIEPSQCPNSPQCSMPKCGPGCQIDYSSKPCPCCKCQGPTTTGGSCDLTVTGPGSVNCTTINGRTQCDIYCDGRYQGRFTCNPGRGWTPALPSCASSNNNTPQCSMPKCGSGCQIDYNSKPCPCCRCGGVATDCSSPPDTGPCRARIERWNFNKDKNACVKFTYGGCKGNGNNYKTKKECEAQCKNCFAPPDAGPCYARIERWYFNKDKNACVKFIYGGCKGNSNNYLTKKECEAQCKGAQVVAAGGNCDLTVTGPGSVNCTTINGRTQCDIYCDGRYQGRFTCNPGRGWTPALPSCASSNNNSPQCSMPKCGRGCQIDYNSKPCPSCKCEGSTAAGGDCNLTVTGPGSVNCTTTSDGTQCDIFCDGKYQGRFTCNPGQGWTPALPSCASSNNNSPQCSMPKCGPSCEIDYNSKPCTSCKCKGHATAGGNCDLTVTGPGSVNCTTTPDSTQCDITCDGRYQGRFTCKAGQGWTPALPSCAKSGSPHTKRCAIPKCRPGCQIDYNSKPCPRCKCEGPGTGPQCSMPKCGPGCQIDHNSKPCPCCKCKGPGTTGGSCDLTVTGPGSVNCTTINGRTQCDITCDGRYQGRFTCNPGRGWTPALPSCAKSGTGPQCSMPKCRPGCQIDYNSKPCPRCKCEGPGTGTCGPNEVYSNCVNPCNDCETRGNCQFLVCNKGCDCRRGYRRSTLPSGICIPESQCPPKEFCSKPGEIYKSCGSPCEETCINRLFHEYFKCPKPCEPGCFCQDGFVRDSNNNCIEPSQCPNSFCGENEEHVDCGSACPPTCDDRKPGVCTLQCVIGCFCKKGFIREKKGGRCIPESQCPSTCGGECDLTVTGSGSSFNCYTDSDGTHCDIYCYGRYEGEFCCKPGKGWTPDLPPCAESKSPNCTVPFCPYRCRLGRVPGPNPCPACICDQNNNSTCGKNEIYSECGTACQGTCAKRIKPCTKQCARGCFCKKDYVREKEGGKCIPEIKCPKGPICFIPLCRLGCRIVPVPNQCPKCVCDKNTTGPVCSIPACKVGCQIVQGPKGECPKCVCDKNTTGAGCSCDLVVTGSGSFFCNTGTSGTQCDIFCDGRYEGKFSCYPGQGWTPALPRCVKPKRPVCSIPRCKVGCRVVQNPRGGCAKCVCDKNTTTPGGCDLVVTGKGSFNCDNFYNGSRCEIFCDGMYKGLFSCSTGRGWTPALPRCVKPHPVICLLPYCKQPECRYVKEPNQPCPRCVCNNNSTIRTCRKNEQPLECGSACPPTCSDRNPVCTEQCINGCFCKKGFIRKCNNGACIPESQCPTNGGSCGKNEEPSDCGTACPPTCSNRNPVCTKQCVKGCFCKEGFIRKCKNGACIPESKCPANGDNVYTDDYEYEYEKDEEEEEYDYSLTEEYGETNENGTCGKNEVYSGCGTACQGTCAQRVKTCTKQCARGCFCKKGYTREKEGGKCIPEEKCPKRRICHLPLCRLGCRIVPVPNQECPKCVCDKNTTGPVCSIPLCKVGCQIVQGPNGGCAKCVCDKNMTSAGCHCDLMVTGSGSFYCTTSASGTQCDIFCDGWYEGKFSCNPGQGWTPSLPRCVKPKRPICGIPRCKVGCRIVQNPFEGCAKCVCDKNTTAGGDCDLVITGPGSFNCITGYNSTRCDIFCDGMYKGLFSCAPGRGWTPTLPGCVKPKRPIICNIPLCKPECQIVKDPNEPCPRCVCNNNTTDKRDCNVTVTGSGSSYNCITGKDGYQCDIYCYGKYEGQFFCFPGRGWRPALPSCAKSGSSCGKNEEPSDCGTACPPTCSNRNPVCTKQCVKGCFCKEGFIRKCKNGACIPESQCPTKGDNGYTEDYEYEKDDEEEEEYDYDFTEEYGETNNNECGKNEVIVKCAKPKWCNTCQIRGNCKLKSCSKGCDCKKGYYRNDKGICMPQSQCSSTCGKNEVYSGCGTACQGTCAERVKTCTKQCAKGCFCKKGYTREKEGGKCIPEEKCPKDHSCPLIKCPANCAVVKDAKSCPKCECEKSPTGKCRPDEQEYQCKPFCANRCNPIKKCPKICIKGCFCKEGLVLNDDGKCVTKDQCNQKPPDGEKCKKNEQYYSCKPTCNNTCENYGKKVACPLYCAKGCFCKKGLVLRKDGECVKPEECKKDTCGPDEQYYQCKPFCTNRCNPPKFCTKICVKGCFCKEGLVLNDESKCIRKDQCNQTSPDDKKCKKNEHYYSPCKPTCNNTCENYGRKGPCPRYCMKGCFCKRGLVLRKDGECVKPEECTKVCPQIRCRGECPLNENAKPCPKCECKKPPTGECGKNEVRLDCGSACPPTCDEKNPEVCTLQCVEGCFCKEGFIREKKGGRCIPQWQCPSGECGKNEERLKCGTACPPTCANKNPFCTKQCIEGCFCKKGFIREKEGGKCIPKSQCPSDTCGENEERSECGTACPATCAIRNPQCIQQCKEGCFCKKGFIREKEGGKCIPESQCPKECPLINCIQGCDLDREHKPCPICVCPKVPVCPRIACPANCHFDNSGRCPKCVCDNTGKNINGYNSVEVEESEEDYQKYEENDEESYEEDSEESQEGNDEESYEENEESYEEENKEESYEEKEDEYNSVERDFSEDNNTEMSASEIICPKVRCTLKCPLDVTIKPCPTCVCPKGDCPENEKPNDCGTACQPTCSDQNRFCTQPCVKGCFCENGYIREKEGGKCIPVSQCSKGTS